MSDVQLSSDSLPHLPKDYDIQVSKVIPYYSSLHQEVINLVKALPLTAAIWMDTGCGTGSLVAKASLEFPETKFLLLDPSEGMLRQARKKLSSCPAERSQFLRPSSTQDFFQELEERPDVITAIQCHHYLCAEDRIKATKVCYDLLKGGGFYIISENIRPLTEEGIIIGKQYLRNFQLSMGKTPEEIDIHLARFDVEYFPITVEDHLRLLRETGFRTVEILWCSYMQAAFYCMK